MGFVNILKVLIPDCKGVRQIALLTPKSPTRGFLNFSLFLAPFRVRGKAGKEKNLNYVQFVVYLIANKIFPFKIFHKFGNNLQE